jgi:hypothetical protein
LADRSPHISPRPPDLKPVLLLKDIIVPPFPQPEIRAVSVENRVHTKTAIAPLLKSVFICCDTRLFRSAVEATHH